MESIQIGRRSNERSRRFVPRAFATATSQRFCPSATRRHEIWRTGSTLRLRKVSLLAQERVPRSEGCSVGWSVRAIAIPGIGPLVAAGPVFAALAGAGAGGAAGGLVGGLVGAGIPEIEAKRYAGRIREGGYLVSVHCDDSAWAKRAEEILEATGGHDVVKTHEATPDYRPDPPVVGLPRPASFSSTAR